MLPSTIKARDTELARVLALALDAVGPLVRIVKDAHNGQLTAEENLNVVQTSLRLLGNLNAQCNRLRRTAALKSLNPRIADMAEKDSLYREAGINLFREGFLPKGKGKGRGALINLGATIFGEARKNPGPPFFNSCRNSATEGSVSVSTAADGDHVSAPAHLQQPRRGSNRRSDRRNHRT